MAKSLRRDKDLPLLLILLLLLLLSMYFERKVGERAAFPQEQRQAEISHDSTLSSPTLS